MAADDEPLATRVRENIESIAALRDEAERSVSPSRRVIEQLGRAIGRPITLLALVVSTAAWIILNVAVLDTPIDAPPFFWLQGSLGLYAALLTTMVLIAQGGQQRDADRRAHLDLHVNLLAEQKATKIIALLEELRRDLPDVKDREDPDSAALQQDFDPKTAHAAIESQRRT